MSLVSVQQLAIQKNEELGNPKLGGQLFLGKNYAKSNILFLGLNPGLWKFGHTKTEYVFKNFGSMPFWTSLLPQNVLLESFGSDFVFWNRNTRFFNLHSLSQIRERMKKATYSFAIPWRTKDSAGLTTFLRKNPKSEEFSREILDIIFDDCKPKFIFIAGKTARKKIQEMFFSEYDFQEYGKGKKLDDNHCFQIFKTSNFYVIQIPHLSNANDYDKLDEIAKMMNEELEEIDFFKQ